MISQALEAASSDTENGEERTSRAADKSLVAYVTESAGSPLAR